MRVGLAHLSADGRLRDSAATQGTCTMSSNRPHREPASQDNRSRRLCPADEFKAAAIMGGSTGNSPAVASRTPGWAGDSERCSTVEEGLIELPSNFGTGYSCIYSCRAGRVDG